MSKRKRLDQTSLISVLLQRTIAFQPIFVHITQSVTAGLFLSQARYWTENLTTKNRDGWFYKSQADWQEETGLTRYEQASARRTLRKAGLLQEKLKGVPATLYFKVNEKRLHELISQFATNQQTGLLKSSKLDCYKPANKSATNQQTIHEITQEITHDSWELESFCESYQSLYGLPYVVTKADRAEIRKLRNRLGDLLTRQLWHKALVNYFASPVSQHTLADLCRRFDTFQRSALDKYNKPTKSNVAVFPAKESIHSKNDDIAAAITAIKSNRGTQEGAKANGKRSA